MNMKVYAHEPGPVSKAILQVIGLFQSVTGQNAVEEADVILVTSREHLNLLWRPEKLFCFVVFSKNDSNSRLPENVFPASPMLIDEKGIIAFLHWATPLLEKKAQDGRASEGHVSTNEIGYIPLKNILVTKKRYHVLVLDNDKENIKLAEQVLSKHAVSLCGSMERAVAALDIGKFDAVLTDMQMPLDRHFKSISDNAINPGQNVPYGFAMIFEATRRGIPVAVVTDGNHHQDWVSAMFDTIKGAIVNGQKVRFFNHIEKRWDVALKDLLEGSSV